MAALVAAAFLGTIGAANANALMASVRIQTEPNDSKRIKIETNLQASTNDEIVISRLGHPNSPDVDIHLETRGSPKTTPSGWSVAAPCRIVNPSKKANNDQFVNCPTAGLASIDVKTGNGNDLVTNITSLPMTVFGGEGNDRLDGGLGLDLVFGENGADKITDAGGDSRLFGPFQNVLDGGAGNDNVSSQIKAFSEDIDYHDVFSRDRLVGGSGIDDLDGRRDNDFIDAVDNQKDTVDCGPGTDQLRRDAVEKVVRECEQQVP